MHLDKRRILRLITHIFIVVPLCMIPSFLYAMASNNNTMMKAFIIPMLIFVLIGTAGVFTIKPSHKHLTIRDGYMSIFVVIFVSIMIGAFPYYIGLGSNFIDAIFESTAGFTTTSATVFSEPTMGNALILWKAVEHWVGGIGVLVFTVSILPILGVGDQQIATAEAHGSFMNKIAPKSKVIAKNLIIIYLLLTVLAFIYFSIANIGLFDAFILSLSTSSTSGVLLHPEGVSYYHSIYVEMGVSIFSLFSALNFVLYLHLYKKNILEIKRNIELRAFLFIVVIATILIGILLFVNGNAESLLEAMRRSFFQVTSFASTSGFALEDYTLWPSACVFLLITLMIIGGCSASTTGSFKVMRFLIVLKLISRGFIKRIHPRAVKAVRIGNSTISAKMVSSVTTFTILYMAIMLFSTIVLSLQNLDMNSTLAGVLGTISNDGISFGKIGMRGDYSFFNPILKIYLSFLMTVGRLGVLTVSIVFLPSFWNTNKSSGIS